MNYEQMRLEVMGLYPWRGWKLRVRDMPNNQVMAIYRDRILYSKPKKKESEYHQMTLGEYFGGEFR